MCTHAHTYGTHTRTQRHVDKDTRSPRTNATPCNNTLQQTATRGDTLQHPATPCNTLQRPALQHRATHCNTLQYSIPGTREIKQMDVCNAATMLQQHAYLAPYGNIRQHTATGCNMLQHVATHCKTHYLVNRGADGLL